MGIGWNGCRQVQPGGILRPDNYQLAALGILINDLSFSLHVPAYLLSCAWLFATLWPVACQAPLSMGFFKVRILEWVAISSSRASSWPRDRTHISCISCLTGEFFTSEPPGKPKVERGRWWGGGNSTHLTGSTWGLKVRICRTLRLEKHWVCPFLDKASTNSKGNKWIPLFLSPWLPSPALSEHLPPKTCISIVSSSSTSCCFLHKPSLSTRRRFTGFYEQEQNRDERPSFLTLRSFIHMSTDLSLNHSTVIAE